MNARVAELEGQLSVATAAQGPLNARVAELEGQLSAATAAQGPLNARVAELEGKLSAATATLSRQQGSEKHPSMSSRELDNLYEEMKRCDEREGQRDPEMCLMQLPSLVSYRYESIKNMCAQDGASTECDGNLKSIEMTYLIGSWVKQKREMRENRTKERVREMQRRAAERKRNDPDGSKAYMRWLKRNCTLGIKTPTDGSKCTKTGRGARECRCKLWNEDSQKGKIPMLNQGP